MAKNGRPKRKRARRLMCFSESEGEGGDRSDSGRELRISQESDIDADVGDTAQRSPSTRGTRKRQRTNRFGSRESTVDHNEFFLNPQLTPENSPQKSPVAPTTNGSNVDLEQFSAMISKLTETVKSIETRFDIKFAALQKQISRIEVKLTYRRESQSESENLGELEEHYLTELTKVGLPIDDLDAMTKLEQELSTKTHEQKMVNSLCLYVTIKTEHGKNCLSFLYSLTH